MHFQTQHFLDIFLKKLPAGLLGAVDQIEPTCFFTAVYDQACRWNIFLVDQQYDHLAIALRRSVMGAGTIQMGQTRGPQIKSPHCLEPGLFQLENSPGNSLVTRSAQNHKRGSGCHQDLPVKLRIVAQAYYSRLDAETAICRISI
jgi:hypothetical protein